MTQQSAAPAATLRNPANRVSRRAIAWWTARASAGWLVLLLVELAAVLIPAAAPGWLRGGLLTAIFWITLVLAAGYLIGVPQWRYRVHRWETTPEAVYTQAGWLNQEWRVAPLSRIQTVDTKRGPLEQLFSIATVTVTTASAAGPLRIAGLDLRVAIDLVEHLTATTQATPGDAT
jgi:membrane protein YdbS with pleckstrin-like domain